jgi:hypothetical protein
MKGQSRPRLLALRRPKTNVGEWLAAMVRGLDALEFLERSRELAAETVVPGAPAPRGGPEPIDESRRGTHHSLRENLSGPGSRSAVR